MKPIKNCRRSHPLLTEDSIRLNGLRSLTEERIITMLLCLRKLMMRIL
nr:hypothetical protein P5667_17540 [Bacillus velezensis]